VKPFAKRIEDENEYEDDDENEPKDELSPHPQLLYETVKFLFRLDRPFFWPAAGLKPDT
jgi:hypothetical protein